MNLNTAGLMVATSLMLMKLSIIGLVAATIFLPDYGEMIKNTMQYVLTGCTMLFMAGVVSGSTSSMTTQPGK